jgi:hypothetical protein
MRVLTLVAFFALQLSVFTCGFDIHVHATDSDIGHIAQHAHDKSSQQAGEHKQASDHGCHVHTSHTFVEATSLQTSNGALVTFEQPHILKVAKLKNLSYAIEYPPKA